MKTHILFLALSGFLLVACASHEGRSLSSVEDSRQEQSEAAHADGRYGREFSR